MLQQRDDLPAVGDVEGDDSPAKRAATRGSVVLTKVRIPHAPSMPVERLDALLDTAYDYRLALVVAPAGSGKTTLLARLAARARGAVGWYRAEAWDREEESLLRHVESALAPQMPGLAVGWESVAEAANALAAWPSGPVLLLIDDLHTLEGTPAEVALGRLVDYAPASLSIVAASRVPPRLNLPRLRVSNALIEIRSEDLRFRSWEVERLFRDYYGEPLPPEELARLARRTEGWAAGLQLFHLATRGKTPDERRRVLAALGPSSRLMRDYLARNVLDQLPLKLRRFLVETSVLGRLSASLCDQLLGQSGSAEMLAELERRNLFVQALADDGVYRYHEVLRSYLQGVLLEETGAAGSRQRFRAAGALLAAGGAVPEAVEAYFRGEDWESARHLLGQDEALATGRSSAWIDALPAAVMLHDPWLLLASARRLRAEGRFTEAVEHYQRAESGFATTDPAVLCRDERQAISAWLEPAAGPARRDWSNLLRSAVTREPRVVAGEAMLADGRNGRLAAGLALLLAGDVTASRRALRSVSEDPASDAVPRAVAGMGAAIAGILSGHPKAALEVAGTAASAETLGLEWLARLGRAGLAIGGTESALKEALTVAAACASTDDHWGSSLASFFVAWGAVTSGAEGSDPEAVASSFRTLGAPVLEAWSRGLLALQAAAIDAPDARQLAIQAEASARAAGVPGARLLSYLALSETSPEEADEYRQMAEAMAGETGIALMDGWRRGGGYVSTVPLAAPSPGESSSVDVPLRVRLLGRFQFELAGRPVNMASMRPRVRSLLRFLSLHAGTPVHHETIEEALWPEANGSVASRNLHVAVAALRRALEPEVSRSQFQLITREGDTYRLAVPDGGEVDLRTFEDAMEAGRGSRERGDLVAAAQEFARALGEYQGELLPEEGPADWVTETRDLYRLSAVEAAEALAQLLLSQGDSYGAARVSTHGLSIERYHDPLWRLLIRAREQAGDQGAATRARLGYGRMLAELGVSAPPG